MPNLRNASAVNSRGILLHSGYMNTYCILIQPLSNLAEEEEAILGYLCWVASMPLVWCYSRGRSVREAEGCCARETDVLLPLRAEFIQPRLCLSLTACCVFCADSVCGSAKHTHLERKLVGAVCECIKYWKFASNFWKQKLECLRFVTHS